METQGVVAGVAEDFGHQRAGALTQQREQGIDGVVAALAVERDVEGAGALAGEREADVVVACVP